MKTSTRQTLADIIAALLFLAILVFGYFSVAAVAEAGSWNEFLAGGLTMTPTEIDCE